MFKKISQVVKSFVNKTLILVRIKKVKKKSPAKRAATVRKNSTKGRGSKR